MIDIENYLEQLTDRLKQHFCSRLLYVGLQGSYLRGEATQSSDIDIMVVLDVLNVEDLESYRGIIRLMQHYEKSCGFICSRTDLINWNPLEICNLLHSTKDCFGQLRDLVPAFTEQDIRNFIKLSVNNLYHTVCHGYIHTEENKNLARLAGHYKGVFFILQNLYYLKSGKFVVTKAELLKYLDDTNRAVLCRSIELNSGSACDFSESFRLLLNWCQSIIETT